MIDEGQPPRSQGQAQRQPASDPFSDSAFEGLDPSCLPDIERQAIGFAHEAGAILLSHFQKPLEIEYKSQNRRDPVTQADRESEDWLRAAIARAYPDHGIVGEENPNSEHTSPDFVWVLDPLDGTTNFLNGLPVFASSIGVLYRGRPVVAAVFAPGPEGGAVYSARRGGGAFQDGRPLAVAENPEPERGRLTGLPSYYWRMWGFKDGLRMRLGEIRSLGSIAYEMVLASRGTMQLCVFGQPRIWDVAAGVLLVTEAGGGVQIRSPGSQAWSPFTSFGDNPTLDQLHDWRGSIMAGNSKVTDHTGDRMWPRARRWFRFKRWIAEKRQSGKRSQ